VAGAVPGDERSRLGQGPVLGGTVFGRHYIHMFAINRIVHPDRGASGRAAGQRRGGPGFEPHESLNESRDCLRGVVCKNEREFGIFDVELLKKEKGLPAAGW
jgi:hypothetical protein